MQNPLFEECEEKTRVAYGGKTLWKNPESFTYTKSFLLPNGEKHGVHKVSRTFLEFDDTIVETSEWNRGRLSGNWEAVNLKGERLFGKFENGKAEGEFVLEGGKRMILTFHVGFLKSWKFEGGMTVNFRWKKKKMFLRQRDDVQKFRVSLPRKRKKKENEKVGNLLLFCLSLYGRTLLNKKHEPFVIGFEDEVFRVPCFPEELCIEELLPKQRWHDTIFCRPNGFP